MNENFEPNFAENGHENLPKPEIPQNEENVLAGMVGAFLFSLVGGVVWFVLYQVGILAAISGIIGVVCAIKGYSVFAKGESVKGVIISTVIAFVVIVIAWYLCLSYDVYDVYQQWYAEGLVDFEITFFDAVGGAYQFLEEPDISSAYFTDLGMGLVFCVIGCFTTVKNAIGKAKNS